MRPSKDQWAMGLAQLTAQRATCLRRSVGAVLLNARGHVLATGYNGVASGLPHCNEPTEHTCMGPDGRRVVDAVVHVHACTGSKSPSGTDLDLCQAVHAEQNALLQCRDVYEIETAYTTTAPCITCCKLLLNTGCKRVVYLEDYVQPQAKALWLSSGRIWERLEMPTV